MRRFMLLGGVFAGLAMPASAASTFESQVQTHVAALTAQPPACATAGPQLAKLTEDKAFASLAADLRADVLMSLLSCRPPARIADIVAAQLEPISRTQGQRQLAEYYLVMRDMRAKAYVEASDRLLRLAKERPDLINEYPTLFLTELANSPQVDNARRRAVLSFLTSNTWPTNTWAGAGKAAAARNGWAISYAETLLVDGDLAGAIAAVGPTPEPEPFQTMLRKPIFKPLLESEDVIFELTALPKVALDRRNALSEQFPQYLAPQIDAINYMVMLDQKDQAIARGVALVTRIEAGEDFLDLSTGRPWLFNGLARAYEAAGRTEEALAAQQRAAEPPYGDLSQVLNLAAVQLRMKRMEGALSTIDKAKTAEITPYGNMVLTYIAACAAVTLDPPRARAALQTLRENWKDSPRHLALGLECHGRTREQAQKYVADLQAGNTPPL